eukprot:GHVQ01020610.1.p1 GENE.GHVQ01020610.1~~GHVQ01020610.1.p1  ORF type:complete len:1033 (-),score=197.13 GHVQ01020610.1:5396-8494(-)
MKHTTIDQIPMYPANDVGHAQYLFSNTPQSCILSQPPLCRLPQVKFIDLSITPPLSLTSSLLSPRTSANPPSPPSLPLSPTWSLSRSTSVEDSSSTSRISCPTLFDSTISNSSSPSTTPQPLLFSPSTGWYPTVDSPCLRLPSTVSPSAPYPLDSYRSILRCSSPPISSPPSLLTSTPTEATSQLSNPTSPLTSHPVVPASPDFLPKLTIPPSLLSIPSSVRIAEALPPLGSNHHSFSTLLSTSGKEEDKEDKDRVRSYKETLVSFRGTENGLLSQWHMVIAFQRGRLCLSCDNLTHSMPKCPNDAFVCPNCHSKDHRGTECPQPCRFCGKAHHGVSIMACLKETSKAMRSRRTHRRGSECRPNKNDQQNDTHLWRRSPSSGSLLSTSTPPPTSLASTSHRSMSFTHSQPSPTPPSISSSSLARPACTTSARLLPSSSVPLLPSSNSTCLSQRSCVLLTTSDSAGCTGLSGTVEGSGHALRVATSASSRDGGVLRGCGRLGGAGSVRPNNSYGRTVWVSRIPSTATEEQIRKTLNEAVSLGQHVVHIHRKESTTDWAYVEMSSIEAAYEIVGKHVVINGTQLKLQFRKSHSTMKGDGGVRGDNWDSVGGGRGLHVKKPSSFDVASSCAGPAPTQQARGGRESELLRCGESHVSVCRARGGRTLRNHMPGDAKASFGGDESCVGRGVHVGHVVENAYHRGHDGACETRNAHLGIQPRPSFGDSRRDSEGTRELEKLGVHRRDMSMWRGEEGRRCGNGEEVMRDCWRQGPVSHSNSHSRFFGFPPPPGFAVKHADRGEGRGSSGLVGGVEMESLSWRREGIKERSGDLNSQGVMSDEVDVSSCAVYGNYNGSIRGIATEGHDDQDPKEGNNEGHLADRVSSLVADLGSEQDEVIDSRYRQAHTYHVQDSDPSLSKPHLSPVVHSDAIALLLSPRAATAAAGAASTAETQIEATGSTGGEGKDNMTSGSSGGQVMEALICFCEAMIGGLNVQGTGGQLGVEELAELEGRLQDAYSCAVNTVRGQRLEKITKYSVC